MARILKTGSGWRVGWDPEALAYPALIGNEDWAVELTLNEFQDFCRLLIQLTDTLDQMTGELMDEEQLQCEVESEWIWLEAFGEPHAYSLKMILNQGRRSEGTWTASAIPGLLQVIQMLKVF